MKDLDTTLRLAARGDQEAWRLLVNEFGPHVFAYLRSQCGDGELAEELTQSTFCTVAAKLSGGGGGYEEKGKFEAWVFRIAMNRLRDEMRRRRRHAMTADGDLLGAYAGSRSGGQRGASSRDGRGAGGQPDASIMSTAVNAESRTALRHAMAGLPAADREVVELRHLAGLSFRQIADLLNEPLGTILARQHRALAKLRTALGEVIGEEV